MKIQSVLLALLSITFGMVFFFSCKKEEKKTFPSTVYAHTTTMDFNIYVGGDLTNHGSASQNDYFPQDPSEIWSLTFLSESEVEIGFGTSQSSIQTQKFDYYFKSDTLFVVEDPQNRDEDFYIGIGNYTSITSRRYLFYYHGYWWKNGVVEDLNGDMVIDDKDIIRHTFKAPEYLSKEDALELLTVPDGSIDQQDSMVIYNYEWHFDTISD